MVVTYLYVGTEGCTVLVGVGPVSVCGGRKQLLLVAVLPVTLLQWRRVARISKGRYHISPHKIRRSLISSQFRVRYQLVS